MYSSMRTYRYPCHVLGRLLTSERCEGVAEVELLLLCRGDQAEELLMECAQGQHLQECVYSMCVLFDAMYHCMCRQRIYNHRPWLCHNMKKIMTLKHIHVHLDKFQMLS